MAYPSPFDPPVITIRLVSPLLLLLFLIPCCTAALMQRLLGRWWRKKGGHATKLTEHAAQLRDAVSMLSARWMPVALIGAATTRLEAFEISAFATRPVVSCMLGYVVIQNIKLYYRMYPTCPCPAYE